MRRSSSFSVLSDSIFLSSAAGAAECEAVFAADPESDFDFAGMILDVVVAQTRVYGF